MSALLRPPREAYVRTSRLTESHITIEPGLELRDGDDFGVVTNALWELLLDSDRGPLDRDPVIIAQHVEAAIKARWPGRAYFIEAHGVNGWIQIFQPFGVPRNP